jgi:hypothetical protein
VTESIECTVRAEPERVFVRVATVTGQAALAMVDDRGSVVRISLSVAAGHQPPGVRQVLLESVFALPPVRPSRRVQVSAPLGDAQLIDELHNRLDDVHARAAGATCLLNGVVRR